MKLNKNFKTMPEGIRNFLVEALDAFGQELSDHLTYYNDSRDLFDGEEALLLGVFNNALVRHSAKYHTETEFGSYNRTDFIGRVDLAVMNRKDEFYLLVEAKKWKFDGEFYAPEKLKESLVDAKCQLKTYYNAWRKKYDQDPHTMLVIFEYVDLGKYEYDPKNDKGDYDDGTNFWAYYEKDNGGLIVYGYAE